MNYPILALIGANIIWGAAIPIFKYSLENVPPFTLLFIRFFYASAFFVPLAIKNWQKMNVRDGLEIVGSGIFGFTLAISFLFLGLPKAPSINFPIIHSASPLLIYLCALLFLKEKPHPKLLIGSLISILGVLIIILFPFLQSGARIGEFEGNLFYILATITYVVYIVISKSLLKRINVYQATLLMFLVASATYFPFMLRELQSWSFAQLDAKGWFGIVFGVIFSSALAYFLQHWAEAKIDAQEVGLFTYLDPVATVVIAIPLLGEVPTIHYFFGAILIFAGIFIAEKRFHWHPIHKLKI